jgi:CSLREA domain-containing protein
MIYSSFSRRVSRFIRLTILALLALMVSSSFGLQAGMLVGSRVALAATTITVTTTDDELNSDGDCSLREAIQAANSDTAVDACAAGSGTDTIQFSVPANSVITLAVGELLVTQDLTIDGSTATNLSLSGNNTNRVFNASASMTITSLTVANGNAVGTGGGITSSSALTLSDMTFNNNTASDNGGGVFANGAVTINGGVFQNNHTNTGYNNSNGGGALFGNSTVTIIGTQFIGNSGSSMGGAIYAVGTATITNAQFLQNAGNGRGGALHTLGSATLTNTLFRGNSVSGGEGGGALVSGSAVVNGGMFLENHSLAGGFPSGGGMTVFQNLLLTGTQFIGNTSASFAGALRVSGTATIENALFARNSAPNGAALDLNSNSQIRHSTFGSPTLTNSAAIYIEGGTVDIQDTIITSHTVGINNLAGTVTEDYNLFFGNTANLGGTVTSGGNNQSSAPHFWAPACDIYKVGPSSGAIDTGTNVAVTTDFEGDARPLLSGFDIGFDEATSVSFEIPIYCLSATNTSPTTLGNPTTLAATIAGGTNVTYAWDFGDGGTASGATTNHTYAAVGTYLATVTAANGLGSVSATTTVTITDLPISGLSAANDSPTLLGQTTHFTATIGTGTNVTYQWDFGDSQIGTGITTSHIYTSAGPHTAIVTALNSTGSASASTPVTILWVKITSGAPPSTTYGSTYYHTFTAGGSGPIIWSIVSGTLPPGLVLNSATGALTGKPTQAGSFNFTIRASNNADQDDQAITMLVNKAVLTVTAQDAIRRVGQANPSFTVLYTGFVNGDTAASVSGSSTCISSATPGSPVGPYAISCTSGTLASTNYTFTFVDGTLTVTNKEIPTIDWNPPVAITYGTPLSATQFNATANFGGSALAGTFTYTPVTGTVLHAGNGEILEVLFTPNDTATYALVTQQVQINILKAPLTIQADDKTMSVGAALPAFTASYSGFVNGDSASVLDSPATLSTTATTNSPAGHYPIVVGGASDADYDITFINGDLTVLMRLYMPNTLR